VDLNDFKANDEPQSLVLVHPVTGADLTANGAPMTLHIIGPDHPTMRALERKVTDRRLKQASRTNRVEITAQMVEEELMERLATAIVGWENIYAGGKPVEWSHEEARQLVQDYPVFREQIAQCFGDRGNFLAAASGKTSKPL
jgi:hypothetical protein